MVFFNLKVITNGVYIVPCFTEPPCLAELERIQVLDGGKRKYGMYPTWELFFIKELMRNSDRLCQVLSISTQQKQTKSAISVFNMCMQAAETLNVCIFGHVCMHVHFADFC